MLWGLTHCFLGDERDGPNIFHSSSNLGDLKKTVHHLAFGSLVSIPLDPWISLKQCKSLLEGGAGRWVPGSSQPTMLLGARRGDG